MTMEFSEIYSLKVTLEDSEPRIWRRIEIPCNFTFKDLHETIQCAMGWKNSSPHVFRVKMKDKITGKRSRETLIGVTEVNDIHKNENETPLSICFPTVKKIFYEYNLENSWLHEIKLEKIISAVEENIYPRCVAGEMACPPENCGGLWEYYSMLAVLEEKWVSKEERQRAISCLGINFDPLYFKPELVKFV